MYTRVLLPCAADGVFPMSAFSPSRQHVCNGKEHPYGCELYDYGSVIPAAFLPRLHERALEFTRRDRGEGTATTAGGLLRSRAWAKDDTDRIVPVTGAHSGFAMYSVASLRRFNASYVSWDEQPVSELLRRVGDDPKARFEWGIIENTWLNMRLPRLFILPKFRPRYGSQT